MVKKKNSFEKALRTTIDLASLVSYVYNMMYI